MASGKRTPKVSRISRGRTLAYARKQKPSADGGEGAGRGDDDDGHDAAASAEAPADKSDAAGAAAASIDIAAGVAGSQGPSAAGAAGISGAKESIGGAPVPGTEAAPPAAPIAPRAETDTIKMAPISIGAPPAMPAPAQVSAQVDVKSVEAPTHMPGPREIPGGEPGDPAPPPGLVPRGDSRSMRRRNEHARQEAGALASVTRGAYEFALVYRIQTYVISRVGAVGTRGVWRVVEYPTPAMASHAYAKECSRFVSEGFSDYREGGG